jgi:hypothetical protein
MLIYASRLDPLPRRVFHLDQVWRQNLARSNAKDVVSIRGRAETCAGADLTALAGRGSISRREYAAKPSNRVP